MADSNAPHSRADVVSEVAAQTGLPASQVDTVIRAFEGSLIRKLASGGEVRILGLGSFKVSQRAARQGRNPKTGESIKIKASKNVRFSAGKAFKDAIAGGKKGLKAAPVAKAAPAKAAAKPAAKAAPAKAAAKPAAKAAPAKAAAKPAAKAAPAKAAAKPAAKAAPAKAGKKK